MTTPIDDGGPAFPVNSPESILMLLEEDRKVKNRMKRKDASEEELKSACADGNLVRMLLGNPENGFMRGMTLRDVFAGMAMQGIFSSHETKTNPHIARLVPEFDWAATCAYAAADAMIKARNTKPQTP